MDKKNSQEYKVVKFILLLPRYIHTWTCMTEYHHIKNVRLTVSSNTTCGKWVVQCISSLVHVFMYIFTSICEAQMMLLEVCFSRALCIYSLHVHSFPPNLYISSIKSPVVWLGWGGGGGGGGGRGRDLLLSPILHSDSVKLYSRLFTDPSEHHHTTQTSKVNNIFFIEPQQFKHFKSKSILGY